MDDSSTKSLNLQWQQQCSRTCHGPSWQVPMLNVTDCIISFCIVLLVTTSTLYLNKIETYLQTTMFL